MLVILIIFAVVTAVIERTATVTHVIPNLASHEASPPKVTLPSQNLGQGRGISVAQDYGNYHFSGNVDLIHSNILVSGGIIQFNGDVNTSTNLVAAKYSTGPIVGSIIMQNSQLYLSYDEMSSGSNNQTFDTLGQDGYFLVNSADYGTVVSKVIELMIEPEKLLKTASQTGSIKTYNLSVINGQSVIIYGIPLSSESLLVALDSDKSSVNQNDSTVSNNVAGYIFASLVINSQGQIIRENLVTLLVIKISQHNNCFAGLLPSQPISPYIIQAKATVSFSNFGEMPPNVSIPSQSEIGSLLDPNEMAQLACSN